jgi:hypothetical protein
VQALHQLMGFSITAAELHTLNGALGSAGIKTSYKVSGMASGGGASSSSSGSSSSSALITSLLIVDQGTTMANIEQVKKVLSKHLGDYKATGRSLPGASPRTPPPRALSAALPRAPAQRRRAAWAWRALLRRGGSALSHTHTPHATHARTHTHASTAPF